MTEDVAGAVRSAEPFAASVRAGLTTAIESERVCVVLSFAVGAVSVLAFAPFGVYPLSVLCLAVVFRLGQGVSPWWAAWRGTAFGVGQFGVGVNWLFIALHQVGGAPTSLSLLLLAALVLAMALYPAAVLGLAASVAPDAGAVRNLLWLPALWTLAEWLRSGLMTGFPWFSLGYSQIDAPLAGYAPLFGVFGVSAAVALSAGLLLQLWAAPRRWLLPTLALGLLWLGGGLLRHIEWTHPNGAPLRVSLVQGDVAQGGKWQAGAGNRDLDRYRRLTRGHWDRALVVWPETALPTLYQDLRPQLNALDSRLRARHTTLLTGLLRAANGRTYNSIAALGATQSFYDKRHRVPFGEYFPVPTFVRRWLASLALPHSDLSSGAARQPLLKVAGYPVGLSICYEDAFSRDILPALPAAALLVNVSDDAWFGRSIGPEQHFQIARMRALETGRYLLRADNSSVTGVVDPHGAVRQRLRGFVPGVLSTRIQPYAGATPFVRWGDAAIVGLALVALLVGSVLQIAGRRLEGVTAGAGR